MPNVNDPPAKRSSQAEKSVRSTREEPQTVERPEPLEAYTKALPTRRFGMTSADLIDKWLSQLDWLWYVVWLFLIYAIALNAGDLRTWRDFGFATLAGVLLVVFVAILKKKKKKKMNR